MLLQIGGHGDQITQTSKVRIVTDYPLPMQVDGEPVLLEASEILIEKKNQANMIAASDDNVVASCVQSAFTC
jgi:hypothetical protein